MYKNFYSGDKTQEDILFKEIDQGVLKNLLYERLHVKEKTTEELGKEVKKKLKENGTSFFKNFLKLDDFEIIQLLIQTFPEIWSMRFCRTLKKRIQKENNKND